MDIGDRMKNNYENRARHYLTRRTPVIIRLDGRAFHTLMRSAEKPFDAHFISAMALSAQAVAEEMQGFKMAYVQSDEVSFLVTDYDSLTTDGWFDYNKSKMETISASLMTAHFNRLYQPQRIAVFDGRAFNIPETEIANYFLWRAKDWERNSVSMYCRSFFSNKQMHGQGRADQHEMLHSIGKNWATDVPPRQKNGTFIVGTDEYICDPAYGDISGLLEKAMTPKKEQVC